MKLLIFILLQATILLGVAPQQQIMHETQIRKIADPKNTGFLNKSIALAQYRNEVNAFAGENKKIPKKDDSIFRIMTYNVHFWINPENTKGSMKEIMNVIKIINPDLLILQEVSPNEGFLQGKHFDRSKAMDELKRLGYVQFSACNTVSGGWFGNIIASKKKFSAINRVTFNKQKNRQNEARCFAIAQTMLPNGITLYSYGTHLEVHDDDTIRYAQIKEIISEIQWKTPNSNVLLAADFNATRESVVVTHLQLEGFKDCFTYMGWQHPTFTSWAGTEIDFIFLSPKWYLPLSGCYVYYDAASDHLPVIMDIDLALEKFDQPAQPAIVDTNYLEELLQTFQRDLEWLNALLA